MTLAAHLLLLCVFLLTGWQAAPVTLPEQLIEVSLISTPARTEAQPIIQPRRIRLVQPVSPPPVIDIAPEPAPLVTATPTSMAVSNGISEQGKNDYIARLRRHLQGFMRFPGDEGEVTLRFYIDKVGRLQSVDIVKSAGKTVLDAEALALMERAQPLPPIPEEFKMERFGAYLPLAWRFEDKMARLNH